MALVTVAVLWQPGAASCYRALQWRRAGAAVGTDILISSDRHLYLASDIVIV